MNRLTTLVTGASSGIGFHLAHEFARHGHPLVITAPVESELQQAADEFRSKHGVRVQVIAKDLEDPQAPQEIFTELAATDTSTSSSTMRPRFSCQMVGTADRADISMVRLNIESVLRLTKLFLTPMLRRGRGRILNTASVARFEPGPLLNTYYSTKAFVLSWSEALAI